MSASDILNSPDTNKIIDWLQRNRRVAWACALNTSSAVTPYMEFVKCLNLNDTLCFPAVMVPHLCSQKGRMAQGFDPIAFKPFILGETKGLCIAPCGHIYFSCSFSCVCTLCNKNYNAEQIVNLD